MNIENHPCFNPNACKKYGRVHLPVAPRCNIQCNFCNRKFDCVNESRPGVTSSILTPFQAMNYLEDVFKVKQDISVVGIAGPGDPFANPDQTIETLELVKSKYKDMLLCVATNGLNLPFWLDEVKKLKVSHVSITVNAIDPEIGKKIYSWVRFNKKSMGPEQGAKLLLERQIESIMGLKERGIIVKVNTIILPGINDHHVEKIAEKMAELKVDLLNCMPYFPNKGSNLSHLEEPPEEMMKTIREKAKIHIPQMMHCTRCRADAVGKLGDETDPGLMRNLMERALDKTPSEPVNNKQGLFAAVATREGVLVNQHLGEAKFINIYDISMDTPVFVEKRPLPKPGGRDFRWMTTAKIIKDCGILLVSGIGDAPKSILTSKGIKILEVNGLIDQLLTAVKNKENIDHLIVREHSGCASECRGTGMGCM